MLSARYILSLSDIKALTSAVYCGFSNFSSFCNTKSLALSSKYKNIRSNKIKVSFSHTSERYKHNVEPVVDDRYENVNIDFITNSDKDLEKKLKILFLEIEVMRQEGQRVPEHITDVKWKELLFLAGRMQRVKTLAFWWRNEILKKKDKIKKEEAKKKKELLFKKLDEDYSNKNDHIVYGFGGSTIFIRIYESAIDNQLNNKLINAMMFGQDLIIDCSYDEHMTLKESSLCAKQLTMVFAENRVHKDPFNIHFCRADPESTLIRKFQKIIPTIYSDSFPINIYNKHYLDIFPKERLVYLTPHCREELESYNPDDIYIIGAMVDKANNDPLSLAKAKSEGLRMAKFPLDRYLDWSIGSKSLTLDQVLKVMLDLKSTRNWLTAFQHIPTRKLKPESRQIMERNRFNSDNRRTVNCHGLFYKNT